jgi:hypothetical protein
VRCRLRHRYEPRYDKSAAQHPASFEMEAFPVDGLVGFMETLRSVTYIRDVCVRCGHVIERVK